eukprot:4987120-Amphidinium_carterae.1
MNINLTSLLHTWCIASFVAPGEEVGAETEGWDALAMSDVPRMPGRTIGAAPDAPLAPEVGLPKVLAEAASYDGAGEGPVVVLVAPPAESAWSVALHRHTT